MPVCLPQLNRREFLRRAALGGLASVLTPSLFAQLAAKPRDPDAVFFLSDLHIAGNLNTVSHGVNMASQLAAVVQEVLAWPVAPGTIIISGDLAYHAGNPWDYATFGQLIAPLRALAPLHLMLGNHDQRYFFWQAFPHDATRADAVPNKNVAVFSDRHANWFLLDSLEVTAARAGLLGPEQLQWLARELAARRDRPAIIVCHHNLDSVVEVASLEGTLSVTNVLKELGVLGGLKDTPALENLLVSHRQIKAFIYGHTHDWHTSEHEHGVHLVNLPPTAYVFTAGRPSGWVRASFSDTGAEFELRCLDRKHPEHGQRKHLSWRAT